MLSVICQRIWHTIEYWGLQNPQLQDSSCLQKMHFLKKIHSNNMRVTGPHLSKYKESWNIYKTLRVPCKKNKPASWPMWLSWLKYCPVHRRVSGSIPAQNHSQLADLIPDWGAYKRLPMFPTHVCLFLLSPSLPLSSSLWNQWKISSGED